MDCGFLINEESLEGMLPDVYAHYRAPVLGALTLFFEGLSARRLETIARQQATLPSNATASERLVLLARNCPVLHKLGQTLARDRNLSAELRGRLQQLESSSPSIALSTVEKVLTHELGPLDRLGVTLSAPALAEASVAVVVAFRRGEETAFNTVFKVLKPGVAEYLEEELNLLERIGSFLDERCDLLGIPNLDYRQSFEMVRDKLQNEVRLDKEQQNLCLAREFYKSDPGVQIPAVLLDLCTPRVTAMERVIGEKATEYPRDLWNGRRRMATLIIEALIARPIFSRADRAPFHADPHAGNLFATNDGRLAVVDWSLIGSLTERERISIMQIMLGAISFQTERIVTALGEVSMRHSIGLPALRSVVCKWVDRLRDGGLPGFVWLTGLLDEAVGKAGLRFGADLMLFRKALLMIENVVADLGAGSATIDQVLLREFLLHFSAEWPSRFLSLPDSRSFATRISNSDLAQLMLSLPWRAIRMA